jgi:hypothetical protein
MNKFFIVAPMMDLSEPRQNECLQNATITVKKRLTGWNSLTFR